MLILFFPVPFGVTFFISLSLSNRVFLLRNLIKKCTFLYFHPDHRIQMNKGSQWLSTTYIIIQSKNQKIKINKKGKRNNKERKMLGTSNNQDRRTTSTKTNISYLIQFLLKRKDFLQSQRSTHPIFVGWGIDYWNKGNLSLYRSLSLS